MRIGLKTLRKFDENISRKDFNDFKNTHEIFNVEEYNSRILNFFGICAADVDGGSEILKRFRFSI